MSEVNLKTLVAELEGIARAAGGIMMGGYRRGASITKKGAIDLVTDTAPEFYAAFAHRRFDGRLLHCLYRHESYLLLPLC